MALDVIFRRNNFYPLGGATVERGSGLGEGEDQGGRVFGEAVDQGLDKEPWFVKGGQ